MLGLVAGEEVEVLSRAEILQTLKADGTLEALPFMPEMLKFCGMGFRVYKRADKTCDTIEKTGARRMSNTVHLEGRRCDGAAHGGCEAGCLLFWKEAWLKRPERIGSRKDNLRPEADATAEERLMMTTRAPLPRGGERFICQATELRKATAPLSRWDPRGVAACRA